MLSKSHPDIATKIVENVASQEGVAPSELSTSLYEVVDPEALENLFTAGSGQVLFRYHGYFVTVQSDGTIGVEPLDS
jgi:hypothetical protein